MHHTLPSGFSYLSIVPFFILVISGEGFLIPVHVDTYARRLQNRKAMQMVISCKRASLRLIPHLIQLEPFLLFCAYKKAAATMMAAAPIPISARPAPPV
jgi:hypothetical protein